MRRRQNETQPSRAPRGLRFGWLVDQYLSSLSSKNQYSRATGSLCHILSKVFCVIMKLHLYLSTYLGPIPFLGLDLIDPSSSYTYCNTSLCTYQPTFERLLLCCISKNQKLGKFCQVSSWVVQIGLGSRVLRLTKKVHNANTCTQISQKMEREN